MSIYTFLSICFVIAGILNAWINIYPMTTTLMCLGMWMFVERSTDHYQVLRTCIALCSVLVVHGSVMLCLRKFGVGIADWYIAIVIGARVYGHWKRYVHL